MGQEQRARGHPTNAKEIREGFLEVEGDLRGRKESGPCQEKQNNEEGIAGTEKAMRKAMKARESAGQV